MGILTDHMKKVVVEQRLGYIATVCPDGTPNLSPKATMRVWDDDHLVFADIASPGTVANLKQNPAIEINIVDPMIRKGYRFKGTAEIVPPGPSGPCRSSHPVTWETLPKIRCGPDGRSTTFH